MRLHSPSIDTLIHRHSSLLAYITAPVISLVPCIAVPVLHSSVSCPMWKLRATLRSVAAPSFFFPGSFLSSWLSLHPHNLDTLLGFFRQWRRKTRQKQSRRRNLNRYYVRYSYRSFPLATSNSRLTAFASKLEKRFSISRETTLQDELQAEIRLLPLPPSSTVAARQIELDKLGTELWNLSTVLRREQQPNGMTKDETLQRSRALCLLRVFAFLLLDTACGQATKARERKHCIRLIKVALKAARVCIEHNELGAATKVLERAADYQDELSKESDSTTDEKTNVTDCLRIEYFAVRTTLVGDFPMH